MESRPLPVSLTGPACIPTKSTLESFTRSPPENKPSRAVIWQVFATCLCFHLLFRRACGGLTQLSRLLAAD